MKYSNQQLDKRCIKTKNTNKMLLMSAIVLVIIALIGYWEIEKPKNVNESILTDEKIEQLENQHFATVNDALHAVMSKITGTRTVIGQTFNPAKEWKIKFYPIIVNGEYGERSDNYIIAYAIPHNGGYKVDIRKSNIHLRKNMSSFIDKRQIGNVTANFYVGSELDDSFNQPFSGVTHEDSKTKIAFYSKANN